MTKQHCLMIATLAILVMGATATVLAAATLLTKIN